MEAQQPLQAAFAVKAWLALGANLGDAQATIRQAIAAVQNWPHTRLLKASSLYRTAPVDADGPDYINAVLEVQTGLSPLELLHHCQLQEQAAGRQSRSVRLDSSASEMARLLPREYDQPVVAVHRMVGGCVFTD